jgi:hypothetical protein
MPLRTPTGPSTKRRKSAIGATIQFAATHTISERELVKRTCETNADAGDKIQLESLYSKPSRCGV